jgi:N-acetyl-anhydromuramyl-L-alanine amidase AmpD
MTDVTWLDASWVSATAPSNHFSSREGHEPKWIWLHYTAGGHYLKSSVKWAQMKVSKAAAHFYVGRVGQIVQTVSLRERAWHGGRARLPDGGREGDKSGIGIEIANLGLLHSEQTKDKPEFYYEQGRKLKPYPHDKYPLPKDATLQFRDGTQTLDVEGWWEPYTENQVGAVVLLCAKLIEIYDIPLGNVIGHEDAAYPMGRKTDPGPLWPWHKFMERLAGTLNVAVPDDVWAHHKTVS